MSKFGNTKIPWADVDMGDLKIEISAASTLGDTPAGRRQRATELAQMGVITLDEARQLEDHPDIEATISMYNAAAESAENAVERILDGEYLVPSPYMNLQVCVTLAQNTYLKIDIGEDRGGAPEEILEGLSDFMAVCAGILNPPQIPGAPTDQAAMPGPTGAPAQSAVAEGSFAPMTA